MGMAGAGKPLWYVGTWATSVFMILTSLIILYLLLWMSFSKLNVCYVDRFIPRFFTADNFRRVFREESIIRFLPAAGTHLSFSCPPLSGLILATSIMVSFLGAWNGFTVPLLFLTDDARYTIGIKLYSFVGSVASGNPKWSLFAAASVVNLIAISVIFLRFRNPLQTTTIEETEA